MGVLEYHRVGTGVSTEGVKSEGEVALGIVIGDVLYHLLDEGHFLAGQLAVFHVLPDEVAQATAEILVARVGEERAAVGQHPYETA